MSEIGILSAVLAGFLSFLSPCVLPLIPAYLSLITGYGSADLRAGSDRPRILARSLVFSAGFTIVFTAMGLVFSGAALLLGGLSRTITLIAGCLVILLGLNLAFDFIKLLDRETRFHWVKAPTGYAGAFLLGLAFAAGWSPCVGPILASILVLAAGEGSLSRSILLLFSYSAALALPFIAAGLFFDRLKPLLDGMKRHGRGLRIASALLLVAIGSLMALGELGALGSAAFRAGEALRHFAVEKPVAARFAAVLSWILAAALVAAVPALKGRGASPPSRAAPTRISPTRAAVAAAFAIIALGEIMGLWSSISILSSWLSFQGA
jgi:cytochrome c-type biogenesis protein